MHTETVISSGTTIVLNWRHPAPPEAPFRGDDVWLAWGPDQLIDVGRHDDGTVWDGEAWVDGRKVLRDAIMVIGNPPKKESSTMPKRSVLVDEETWNDVLRLVEGEWGMAAADDVRKEAIVVGEDDVVLKRARAAKLLRVCQFAAAQGRARFEPGDLDELD